MDQLASVCEEIARFASRLKKVAILAAYLRALNDEDLERAVRFLCCPAKLSVGHATLREALLGVVPWDLETVRICYRETGDAGEAISLLIAGGAGPMPLAEADRIYTALARARSTAEKVTLLRDVFTRHRPATVKYFVKAIGGDLRIGLQAKMVEEAVAQATGAALTEVRAANNRLGDLAQVAVAARHGHLHAIAARLFHPLEFMLAKPLEATASLEDPAYWLVEDKYDGIRAQAHFEHGRVAIYSRGMDEITASFPEIDEALRFVGGAGILDGEILAWRDGRALNFNALQQRLARKRVTAAMLAEVPVVFMAYDLLYRNGELLLDRELEERRRALENALPPAAERLLLAPQRHAAAVEDIDRAFEQARASGNEGLVLKRRGSLYESGRRSGAWLKVKRPYATLDVVITAAEQGTGRRATVLSDYTFGVRSGDAFANVGKAYSGLTDAEVRDLTRRLRALATDRFGRVMLVKPEIVLEVAFDGVQRSPRHKGGYALRFPRIVRWRKDKKAEEADTLERVAELYERSLAG